MAPCEWVIDIIKEWVLAQAYATIAYVDAEIAALKAWVEARLYLPKAELPEYMISASVTGDLTPDVTCRYFRAGDYNGQPYYRRPDGSWFIWWDGDVIWHISTALGGLPGGYWSRVDPDIEGPYPINFLTAGTPVVTLGSKYLINSFVDRGDPGAQDWTKLDFTVDAGWHDLDLSAIVPAGAKSVLFVALVQHTLVNKLFMLRKKGNANIFNISSINTVVANVNYYQDWVCPCDKNRVIQYRATPPAWAIMSLLVKGWWF